VTRGPPRRRRVLTSRNDEKGSQVDSDVAPGIRRGDDGMTTAEYAVGTLAACAFAAVLFEVVSSGQVRKLLVGLVTRALGTVA
jgi:hypothetical protein